MSVVIAIKDYENDRIVLGCDGQITAGNMKRNSSSNQAKIWNVRGLPFITMGGVGLLRSCQIIRVEDNLISGDELLADVVDENWVIRCLVPRLFDVLRDNKLTHIDDSGIGYEYLNSSFIFCYKNQAYKISTDGSVTEIEDYLVIGSGEQVASGVLEKNVNLSPKERIIEAINTCSDIMTSVNDCIEVLTTDDLADVKGDEEIGKILDLVTDKWENVPAKGKEVIYNILNKTPSEEE